MSDVLAKIYRSNSCICIRTFSRKNGRRGRFYILTEDFMDWLGKRANDTAFHDTDCGNYVSIKWVKARNTFMLRFSWLSEDSAGNIRGVRECFELDGIDFLAATASDREVVLLGKTNADAYGKVIFHENAQRQIAQMDARTRRALSKAMRRDALAWPSTTTDVYADGGADFFFRNGYGVCGGLILHRGSRDSVSYGVHT